MLRPLGVFGVIAPFNFPVALSISMVSCALIAGNSVVFKPGDLSGLTGAMIVPTLEQAGLPAGAINLVLGDGQLGAAMVDHPGFDGFAFTGSHRVGMAMLRKVAGGRHHRPVLAEMGGKNPTYVAASADLDVAAEGLMRSAFGLQGQKCSAGSKVCVHTDVAPAFIDRLLALTKGRVIGDPRRREVFMGPLVHDAALSRYLQACADPVRDGRLLHPGRARNRLLHRARRGRRTVRKDPRRLLAEPGGPKYASLGGFSAQSGRLQARGWRVGRSLNLHGAQD